MDSQVRGVIGFFRSLLNPYNEYALRTALSQLWSCPADLIERACHEISEVGPLVARGNLSEFLPLTPWLNVLSLFVDRTKEKPRKLLEDFCKKQNLHSEPLTCLLESAVFSSDLEGFLNNLLLGEETDVKRSIKKSYPSGAVRLMTLHGSKGLEFPVVFLCGITQTKIPLQSERYVTDIQEERRLFFVGMTRAKEELLLLAPGAPSFFLDELPRNSCVSIERVVDKKRQNVQQLSLF